MAVAQLYLWRAHALEPDLESWTQYLKAFVNMNKLLHLSGLVISPGQCG